MSEAGRPEPPAPRQTPAGAAMPAIGQLMNELDWEALLGGNELGAVVALLLAARED